MLDEAATGDMTAVVMMLVDDGTTVGRSDADGAVMSPATGDATTVCDKGSPAVVALVPYKSVVAPPALAGGAASPAWVVSEEVFFAMISQ